MHSGSKFWSTLPISKKKVEEEGILSKEKPFEFLKNNIKIDEDLSINIKINDGISKDDIYFVLENSMVSSGNSFVMDPKIDTDNVTVRITDNSNKILGFGLSIPCTLCLQNDIDENIQEHIESGMTTHLCISRKHRSKELAKYIISGVIDYGYKNKIYTGYHYILNPKTAANILVFNYYRPLNLEVAIQFGYEVPMFSSEEKFNLENVPDIRQLNILEDEYRVYNNHSCSLHNTEFNELRFFQSTGRKLSIIFSALRFEQLKKQFSFVTIRKNGKIIGIVMYKTMIVHVGKIMKGCPTAQICLFEIDKDYRSFAMYELLIHLKKRGYVVMSGVIFGELADEKFRKESGLVLCGIQYLDFYNFNVDLKNPSEVNVLYY